MTTVWRVCVVLAACAAAASSQDAAPADQATSEAAEVNPDAEGVPDGGDTEARFLFKTNRRRYNRRYPGYNGYNNYNGYDYNYNGYDYNNNGYDYNNNGGSYYYQCQRCGYGSSLDYSTSQRCCSYGYYSCCQSGDNEVKPGVCPYNSYGTFTSSSYCRSECSRDADCYSTQKCCQRGCSRTCQYPNQGGGGYEKPGTCPYSAGSQGGSYPFSPYSSGTRSTIGGSYCRRDCSRDQECPGSQKCCDVNCSSICITPQRYY